MAELKPCPFCGGTKLKIDSKRTFQYGGKKHCSVSIRCMKCRARGPVVGINMSNGQYDEREICESAVCESWNRRAGVEVDAIVDDFTRVRPAKGHHDWRMVAIRHDEVGDRINTYRCVKCGEEFDVKIVT